MKKRKKILVKSKNQKTTDEAAKFLRTIADRIGAKKIKFVQGDQETEVELPNQVHFSFNAREKELKKKGMSRSLSIQIRWYEGGTEAAPLELK